MTHRARTGDALPGARGLEEGHELAFVVLRAARDDHLAVALVGGDARLERRRLPQLQRIGRLHVVVAVEQHVRRALWRALVVADHHGVPRRRHHLGIEADVLELARAPIGRLAALRLVFGIGGDAGNADQLEQPLERLLLRGIEFLQDLGEHVAGLRAHGHSLGLDLRQRKEGER